MPSKVENVQVSQNQSHLMIEWETPVFIRDVQVSYEIKCNESFFEKTSNQKASFKIDVSGKSICKVSY